MAGHKTSRVFLLPTELYGVMRREFDRNNRSNRDINRDAIDHHLVCVRDLLFEAGAAPTEGERKSVRPNIDVRTLDSLREASAATGVDVTALLLMCLRRELGLRVCDATRLRRLAAGRSAASENS